MTPFYDNAPEERNNDQHYDTDSWQPLRRPLKQLADRLHLQRATMIAIAEAIGIPTEAD